MMSASPRNSCSVLPAGGRRWLRPTKGQDNVLRTPRMACPGLERHGHVAGAVGIAGDGGQLARHVRLPAIGLRVCELVHVVAGDGINDLGKGRKCIVFGIRAGLGRIEVRWTTSDFGYTSHAA